MVVESMKNSLDSPASEDNEITQMFKVRFEYCRGSGP